MRAFPVLIPLTALALASSIALAASAAAAVTTVTDCTAAPVSLFNGKTVIDLPGGDVVLRCALQPLPGTDGLAIAAASILVDGPLGGSVAASGSTLALSLEAEHGIEIRDAHVSADNNNGHATITAVGSVLVTAGSEIAAGDKLTIECTGPACPIQISGTNFAAHELRILAEGTVTIGASSNLTTHGPTDLLKISSADGDVLLASVITPAPASSTEATLQARALLEARAFCHCNDVSHDPNTLTTGVEGNLLIEAPNGRVDLTGVHAHAGEDIDITALTDAGMTAAAIDNCGPKTGKFTVVAATCGVGNATLLDDEPDAKPTLQCAVSGVATTLGSCSAQH